MKLKDSLRGFGIGILFTTMVFVFTGAKKDMDRLSEQGIIKKAQHLGMLTQEEVDEIIFKYTLANVTPTPTLEPTQAPDATQKPTIEPTKQPDSTQKPTTESTEQPDATQKPTTEPTEQPEPTQKPTTEPTQKPKAEEYLTITISRGMYSASVAKLLKEKGLVDSADKFDQYLCDYGYESKVRVGTYKIKKGSSYEEIAKKITK